MINISWDKDRWVENAGPGALEQSSVDYICPKNIVNSSHLPQFVFSLWTDLPLCRTVFEGFEEVLDLGLGTSPFSDGVVSLIGPGKGAGSWIIRTSSLLCWPRCCLAKSKPFTLGACSCERIKTQKKTNNEWQWIQKLWLKSVNNCY